MTTTWRARSAHWGGSGTTRLVGLAWSALGLSAAGCNADEETRVCFLYYCPPRVARVYMAPELATPGEYEFTVTADGVTESCERARLCAVADGGAAGSANASGCVNPTWADADCHFGDMVSASGWSPSEAVLTYYGEAESLQITVLRGDQLVWDGTVELNWEFTGDWCHDCRSAEATLESQ